MCSIGYAGWEERKPDWIIGRLPICGQGLDDLSMDRITDPVLSNIITPSMAILKDEKLYVSKRVDVERNKPKRQSTLETRDVMNTIA
jgi:hypothetical protein